MAHALPTILAQAPWHGVGARFTPMHAACAEARIRAHTSHGAAVRALTDMGIPLNTAARYVLAYLRSTRTWRI